MHIVTIHFVSTFSKDRDLRILVEYPGTDKIVFITHIFGLHQFYRVGTMQRKKYALQLNLIFPESSLRR